MNRRKPLAQSDPPRVRFKTALKVCARQVEKEGRKEGERAGMRQTLRQINLAVVEQVRHR